MIKRRIVLLAVAVGVIAVLLLVIRTNMAPSVNIPKGFSQLSVKIADFGIFDLGVADANDDGMLDIFTSNHSGPQSLLINQGKGGFKESFSALGLDQDRSFPGLAVLPQEPPIKKPGLYVNWRGPAVAIRVHGLNGGDAVSGEIELLSSVVIEDKDNFEVAVKTSRLPSGVSRSTIAFKGGNGYFAFKPYLHALPIRFRVHSGVLRDQVYVGPNYVVPSSLEFAINMRDRHGRAWADYNGDGRSDLFITRGGHKGWIGRMPDDYWDELFIRDGNGFKDIGQKAGLIKGDCSGRQAAWVDYNGDGRLDLYVSCARTMEYQPNKLFQQTADGHFIDVAEQAGLNIGLDGEFVWLDADGDGDQDFFWVNDQAFYLYKNNAGRFTPTQLGINPAGRLSTKLSVSDFDGDGDLDVFAASPRANALCINVGGSFIITDPTQRGLPGESMTANWVDYNNDGRIDIHAVPNGLYEQIEGGRFKKTESLNVAISRFSATALNDARATWFDMDNDGARDLVLALDYRVKKGRRWAKWVAAIDGTTARLGGLPDYWNVALVQNKSSGNHWLEIHLAGPPGNRPAIGATVTVITPDAKYMQSVGEAEGSRYSQGQYRLYFGLGKYEKPVTVRVKWPDGVEQELRNVEHDQLLSVERKES